MDTINGPCKKVKKSADCYNSDDNFYSIDGKFLRADEIYINPVDDKCCWRVEYRGDPERDAEVCKFRDTYSKYVYRGDCSEEQRPSVTPSDGPSNVIVLCSSE